MGNRRRKSPQEKQRILEESKTLGMVETASWPTSWKNCSTTGQKCTFGIPWSGNSLNPPWCRPEILFPFRLQILQRETSTYLRNASNRFLITPWSLRLSNWMPPGGASRCLQWHNGILRAYVPTRRRMTRWIACSMRGWVSSAQRRPSDCVRIFRNQNPALVVGWSH